MIAVVSPLHYQFMQNAFLAGTLVAIGAGIMGYFMVLRSQTFAGHSLANVGFAGATGAAWLGAPAVWGLFIAGAAAAAAMHALGSSEHPRVSDVAIGAVFTASLALGFLFVHLETSQNSLNIYNVLFGNVLGISDSDVRTVALTIVPVVVIVAIAARPALFASIDAEAAAARGVPVRWLSLGFLMLLAMVVAVAVQIVGVLLIFSLLVTPAATARYLTSRPWRAVAVSIALAIAFTWLGLIAGYYSAYPVSFFITTFAFGTYVVVRVAPLFPRPPFGDSGLRLGFSGAERGEVRRPHHPRSSARGRAEDDERRRGSTEARADGCEVVAYGRSPLTPHSLPKGRE